MNGEAGNNPIAGVIPECSLQRVLVPAEAGTPVKSALIGILSATATHSTAYHASMPTIDVIQGDITTVNVDAIVNAANELLLGGGGVDGAIHRAAGPQLLEECRKVAPCPTGEARLTGGYKLPAKYVIHTVGPVWHGGGYGEAELLANCYRHSLSLAIRHHIKTIAFPAISCGIFGYPIEQAAEIAIEETARFLSCQEPLDVTFVCFGSDTYDPFAAAVQRLNER